MRPCGLLHFSAGLELAQHGLDIDDRSSVDGIELRNEEFIAFDAEDATDCATEAIRTILGALRENADFWPVFVVSGMTCAVDDFRRIDLREKEDYFAVREIRETCERLGREFLGEGDA